MVIIYPLKKTLLGSGVSLSVTQLKKNFFMETYRNLMETIKPIPIKSHYMTQTQWDCII